MLEYQTIKASQEFLLPINSVHDNNHEAV